MAKENYSFPNKSLKWLEVPIQKFNIAVSHFVDLLKTYDENIRKLTRLNQNEEFQRIKNDASRTVSQLESLIRDIDNLRCQVIQEDIIKFDKLISNSKNNALLAIESHEELLSRIRLDSYRPTESCNGDLLSKTEQEHAMQHDQLQIIADLSENIKTLEQQSAAMEKIEEDVKDVHLLFQDLAQLVEYQGERVEQIEEHVEQTHLNVLEGEGMLAQAARYKQGAYPLLGALIGSVLGGPVGLLAGFKLGSLTAVGCGFLGFTGGKMLKSQNETNLIEAENHRKELKN